MATAEQTIDDEQRRRLQQNPGRLTAVAFFTAALVIFPVIVPFFQSLGLSMTDIFVLEAMFAGFVVILEVPSGYLADMLGRRLALILGGACWLLCHILLFISTDFWSLVLFELTAAVAVALLSGTDIALLYDSMLALDTDESTKLRAMGRIQAARSWSQAITAVLGGVLVVWSFEPVLIAQVLFSAGPLVLAFTIVEAPRSNPSDDHWINARNVTRTLFEEGDLRRLLTSLTVLALATMYAVWMYQDYWADGGIALVHFGYLWAAYNVAVALANRYAADIERRYGLTVVSAIMCLAPGISYLGMGLAAEFIWLGVACGFIMQSSRGLQMVILRNAFNRNLGSELRATANSIASVLFRGAFIVTGPAVGYAIDLWSSATVFVLLGVLFLIVGAWQLKQLPRLLTFGSSDS
ncbi:MAG: MFS transporter [Pseudomonadota bacterium]